MLTDVIATGGELGPLPDSLRERASVVPGSWNRIASWLLQSTGSVAGRECLLGTFEIRTVAT
jgi:hypothetical protein